MTIPAFPSHRPVLALLALSAALALGGCSSSSSDLDAWIAQVKKKPARAMEPLPASPQYDRFTYQAHGLRDPFMAFAPAPVSSAATGPRPDANRVREPLEEFALDSLKMVGTIGAGATRQGLVSDPTGTTHRVSLGRYLGQRDGRVVGIGDERIDLIELVPDGRGGWEETPAVMVLVEP